MVSTGSLAVVYRSVDELIPYARNARTHSEAQIAQIAGSIREFGFTAPVLLDGESGILAGHGRVLAARKLGMDQVPCIELAHLTAAQRRAYILADNKLAINAGWDEALLRVELADLAEMAFDLSLIGFGNEIASPPVPKEREIVEMTMRYQVLFDCEDERHQALLLEKFQSEGVKCRPLIL